VAEGAAAKIDLHCHSTASDGTLSPAAVVQRAAEQGVALLALTDHDTLSGQAEAFRAAAALPLKLISGVEVSADFHGRVLHVVGLDVRLDADTPLARGLAESDRLRRERGAVMQDRFVRKGMADVAERAEALCQQGQALTRTHFARALVELNHCQNLQQAFDRWLGQGRPCYCKAQWPALEQVVDWITASGGAAVLAHPLRYRLSGAWIRRVLTAFVQAGGCALEVVTGRNDPDGVRRAAQWASSFDLLGSAGSDFHTPEYPWLELGRLQPMPAGIRPLWSRWLEPPA